MKRSPWSLFQRWIRQSVRQAVARLPRAWRFALFRSLVACDDAPDARLELKIAETREEMEACFRLLHDAYVAAGFMVPDASGLRVTPYHALPTTTTLCAKFEGRVVGTMTLIRDGVFGFPMQSAFDLTSVRAKRGHIAEVSALAIHPDFRTTGGWILFPLMKFMYEYCTRYFDTRHLVIAVNPDKIELYESLLFFERLDAAVVDHYDFANGAPAVGATLDLHRAQQMFSQVYGHKGPRRNLHRYFVDVTLPNIRVPARPYHTTNDPVLTPDLIDHFFNHRTQVFAQLDDRRRMLLRSIYDAEAYDAVLPPVRTPAAVAGRRHPRFSVSCPAEFTPADGHKPPSVGLNVIELSSLGFRAECAAGLPLGTAGRLHIELGTGRHGFVDCEAVHQIGKDRVREYGFKVIRLDQAWLECVGALENGQTHADLLQPHPSHRPDDPPGRVVRPAPPEPAMRRDTVLA